MTTPVVPVVPTPAPVAPTPAPVAPVAPVAPKTDPEPGHTVPGWRFNDEKRDRVKAEAATAKALADLEALRAGSRPAAEYTTLEEKYNATRAELQTTRVERVLRKAGVEIDAEGSDVVVDFLRARHAGAKTEEPFAKWFETARADDLLVKRVIADAVEDVEEDSGEIEYEEDVVVPRAKPRRERVTPPVPPRKKGVKSKALRDMPVATYAEQRDELLSGARKKRRR